MLEGTYMSGHSKWATTKHRKAAQDAKRSALFSKLSRNITVAAKEGGDPNPDNNASLAAAIEKAKGYSLPKDKIKVAIDKAFGSGKDSANYETVVYEGYGPAGVAVLCEALTDNRNRTAADVRAAFSHAGGNLGTSGSVAFQFERKGQNMVPKEVATADKKHPGQPTGAAADDDDVRLIIPRIGGVGCRARRCRVVAMRTRRATRQQSACHCRPSDKEAAPVNKTMLTHDVPFRHSLCKGRRAKTPPPPRQGE